MNIESKRKNASGFRGIYWREEKKKFLVQLNIDKKAHHIGYFKDIEDAKNALRDFIMKNNLENRLTPPTRSEHAKKYRDKEENKIKLQKYAKKYNAVKKEIRKSADQTKNKKAKIDVLNAYGTECECCGIDDIDYLTVDHANNDGGKHRKQTNTSGSGYYHWLRKNGFPKDLGIRILCYNCNCARERSIEKKCPHKLDFDKILQNENLY